MFYTLSPGISFSLSWKHRTDAGPLQDVTVLHDGCSLSARVTEALDEAFSDIKALPSLCYFNKPGHVQPNTRMWQMINIASQTLKNIPHFIMLHTYVLKRKWYDHVSQSSRSCCSVLNGINGHEFIVNSSKA